MNKEQSLKILLLANTDWYLANFRLSLIRSLIQEGHEVVLVTPPGRFQGQLRRSGAKIREIALSRGFSGFWQELKSIYGLVKIYFDEKPDVVHHFTLKCIVYGGFAAKLTRCKFRVSSFTGLGYLFTTVRMWSVFPKAFVLLALRFVHSSRCSRVIVQNDDDRIYLLAKRIIPPKSCVLIPGSGVNTIEFSPSIRQRKRNSEVVILMAARILRDKGVLEYFEAARLIKKRHRSSPIKFVLAGNIDPGNPSAISKQDLEKLIAQGDVDYVGDKEKIQELLAISDIVVLPSYREGLPRIILEALSCAIPVIGSDVPGIRDILSDGETGLLVPAKDSKRLAEAIVTLSYNRQLREKLGSAGRNSIHSKYDEESVVQQTWNVYAELLGS